ncbi:hypothetical protein [Leptolyngbya sp. 7M]|nr:hypothetical protein [Leptolyngbya sp. 7M]QYO64688.1 hypothetical protein JVX88_34595 [Leptolyngbya sp. 7M]
MSSVVVDFAREKEAGYQKIFSQLPRLSSVAANAEGAMRLRVTWQCN